MEHLTVAGLAAAVKACPGKQGSVLEQMVLQAAFDLVANKKDWKARINAKIHAETCDFAPDVLSNAIVHFTATVPTIMREGAFLIIHADGYRMGPAGDH